MDLDDAVKAIRNAAGAGVACGILTLVAVGIATAGVDIGGLDAWALVDVALIFALAFGISRRSRVCATTMLIYFVASKIMMIAQTGQPGNVVGLLLFGWLFLKGAQGTFAYHELTGGFEPDDDVEALEDEDGLVAG